jgi:hypothetical protein
MENCKFKRGSRGGHPTLATFGALVLIACAFGQTLAFDKELERSRLDGHDKLDINLFIEQNVHFIHARMDLKPAVIGLVTLRMYVNKFGADTSGSMNKVLAKNLEKKVVYLATQLVRVAGKDNLSIRNKRSIDIIGNLISELFGNPGPEDWKKNNLNILALKNAIARLAENSDIDHADIDLNRNAIEKHNNELRSLSAALSKNENELLNVENEINVMKIFFEISTMIEVLDNLVGTLLEIKNDGSKGYCNDRAIDKTFLVENIQGLEANKVGLSPIFGSWQWRQYYRFEMCTLAIDKEALWITLRVPLVRISENMIRVIPQAKTRFMMTKINSLGLDVTLFREKNNDNFHVMTQTSLEMCNVLGNTRTCGVRNAKFRANQNLVIPVEFAHNKFVLVGDEGVVKLMERCSDKVTERNIEYNSVIALPDNCSYVSADINIERREQDSSLVKAIGLIEIDKFEMRKFINVHQNLSQMEISGLANRSHSSTFERNRKEILQALKDVDTKHDDNWSSLYLEKWVLIGSIGSLVALTVCVKLIFWYRKRQARFEQCTVVYTKGQVKIEKKECENDIVQNLTDDNLTNDGLSDCGSKSFSSPRSNMV